MQTTQVLIIVLASIFLAPLVGAEFYVSPDGSDENPGTKEAPFLTLERARDEMRAIKTRGPLPEGDMVVNILPGDYPVREPFQLTAEDSGTAQSPIVYRGAGAEPPRFNGGVRLSRFTLLEDAEVLARLPESAHGHVWETDLAEAGVADIIPFARGGFASGRGFRTHPEMQLFVNGAPMTTARWPNDGFVQTGEAPGPLTLASWDKRPGAPHGVFQFDHERLTRWADEPNGWLYGYWYWDWADSYERIEGIDLEKREILSLIHISEPTRPY